MKSAVSVNLAVRPYRFHVSLLCRLYMPGMLYYLLTVIKYCIYITMFIFLMVYKISLNITRIAI